MLYGIGKDVATILQLDNPETYTGHCFRRTAATMEADGGATTQQLQRAFRWKSVNTVQKYVEESQSGVQVMASILTKTITSSIMLRKEEGEGCSSTTKTYNIYATGEDNTYNFF